MALGIYYSKIPIYSIFFLPKGDSTTNSLDPQKGSTPRGLRFRKQRCTFISFRILDLLWIVWAGQHASSMSYGLNSLKGALKGNYIGSIVGAIKEDTRSVAYGSYDALR